MLISPLCFFSRSTDSTSCFLIGEGDKSPERGYQPWASAPGHGKRTAPAPTRPGCGCFSPRSFPDLRGSREQQRHQGRSGNLSPVPPLGLKGLALHMAPSGPAGTARWEQRAGSPPNPTTPDGVAGGTLAPQRVARWLPDSPAPLALPVGGRGRGASALFPGRRGGGDDIAYPRY